MRPTLLAGAAGALACVFATAAPSDFLVYVGTYARQPGRGIYAWRLDAVSGKLSTLGLAAEAVNPSFLAVHPNRRFLYAVSEVAGASGQGGGVAAFAIDPVTGKLRLLNRVSSQGSGPAYVAVDRGGRSVLVANYGSGSVAALPVREDGSLGEASAFVQHSGSGPNAKRQQGPHAHSIGASPNNRFVLAADLGLDRVLVYRFDASKGSLAPNEPPSASVAPGAGPRHFAFDPDGRRVYVINELASTVTAFSWDRRRGTLANLQTVSTLPSGFQGQNYCAEVVVHPNGRFLYGSNRGHDSIAVFRIDSAKGTLTPAGHFSTGGRTPRNFAIDPTGKWLLAANQNSGTVVVFRIDPASGALAPSGQTLQADAPVCVRFVPLD